MTADLDRQKEQVPQELVPSVGQLTASLRAVQDPKTPPQERDAVIRSARAVSSALKVIADPGTPGAVRGQLTGLVKQVTSTLDAANRPGLAPEDRRTAFFVADRTAPALRAIGDSRTPHGLRNDLAGAASGALSAVQRPARRSGEPTQQLRQAARQSHEAAQSVAVVVAESSDPSTPDDGKKELAQSAHEASASVNKADDPTASDEERDKARQEADRRIDSMERKLEEVISAHGLPDVPLGKAAEVCTNAVFDSAPQDTLGRNLKTLLPKKWSTEGVKDFWKSKEKGNDVLDVLTQLRNDAFADAPMEVERLVPGLAETVPARELFGTLGTPALHCLRAALQLDKDSGIQSGTWVKKAEEKE
ncbi:hypothetical protein ABZ484_19475 [Streptomyces sp. NPDC006393]|uniref:hypothetical protein n=1 Tax=Streptomyces sp. NPDC006393 TaxID=3156763 RepID=UPI00340C8169